QLGRRRALDDAPAVENRDAVGDGAGQAQIVGDDHLGAPAHRADASDQRADLLGEDGVQVGGGLVVEDQLGIDGEGAGDRGALAHPARDLRRQLALDVAELHLLEHAADGGGDVRRDPLMVLAEPQRDVLPDRERPEQGGALEHHRDAEGLLPRGQRQVALEREVADDDASGVGPLEADDLAEQDRFALAALADDRQQLARSHREVDAREHLLRAVALADTLEDDGDPARAAVAHRTVKLRRTMRKSRIRIHTKLHTTAAVVDPAMPSAPPRVRSPKVHGTIAATTPKQKPFTRPTRTSLSFTHSNMRAKYSGTESCM